MRKEYISCLHGDPYRESDTYVELLSRERSSTDSGGVRLDHTDNGLDHHRGNTQTGADTADRGSTRRDVGVGSVIDVKHERVGTFDKDSLVLLNLLVQEGRSIDDERLQSFCNSLSNKGD